MRIRGVRRDELAGLQEIELLAGRAFADIGMPEVAGDEPASIDDLARYHEAGLAWVAVDDDDAPIAYLIAELVDGVVHVEQVSVHPTWARRGIGRELLEHAASHAAAAGLTAVTLTTFADVPWNAPYYARCGFKPLDSSDLGPELRAIRQREADLGLDRWPRLAMIRPV